MGDGTRVHALFANRRAAGAQLGRHLGERLEGTGVVLALPRGGVPVALEVSRVLGWPLDVVVARKLGVPGIEEVAFGSIAEGLETPVDDVVAKYLGLADDIRVRVQQRETREMLRRLTLYRGDRPLPGFRGQTVVLVDDGLASGSTLRAVARAVRYHRPARIIAAVPVANHDGIDSACRDVDEVVAIETPSSFGLVSDWYDQFDPVSDLEVLEILGRPMVSSAPIEAPREWPVRISVPDGHELEGDFGEPASGPARGLIVLVHGGGSSRMSVRNRFLAGCLREDGWATLRLDLLTIQEQEREALDGHLRFDVPLIAERLLGAVRCVHQRALPGADRVILFGASTGAAAAVKVAALEPNLISAVVARGGRVDLVMDSVRALERPLLMIVGTQDELTLRASRQVLKATRRGVDLAMVRGAAHTFEESGAIGQVDRLARRWLDRHVSPRARRPGATA